MKRALFASIVTLAGIAALPSAAEAARSSGEALVWKIEDPRRIGGRTPQVLGSPRAVVEDGRKAVRFNGASDGLILDHNPLEGWRAFTIEVFFKPDGDGPAEQRFVHLQDAGENRALVETRVVAGGKWYLDTFLYSRPDDKGLTLVDREELHPADRWFWAALVYDGRTMTHFVNGVREREGEINFGPMREGQVSLGVRLNRVYWFKGCIAEIRFHPRAVPAADLQRPK